MAYLEDFLKGKYSEFVDAAVKGRRGIPSQADFARYLSAEISQRLNRPIIISNTTFSQWATGNRPPTAEHKRWLAAFFGPVIYDELGEPREMPTDPITNTIMETVAYKLDRDQQKKVARLFKDLASGKLSWEKLMSVLDEKPAQKGGEREETKSSLQQA